MTLLRSKGYQGEVQFDRLTEKLQRDCHILNDLQLESNKSSFQLDSSLIFQDTYSLFEVKNFEGEYVYDPEYFRSEEHTSELQSLMRISYAVFCLKKKKKSIHSNTE